MPPAQKTVVVDVHDFIRTRDAVCYHPAYAASSPSSCWLSPPHL